MSFVLLFGIVTGLLAASIYFRTRLRKPLPPGPRRLPLIGNALDMPSEKEWLTYTAWGKKYGNIVSLSIFGRSLIILNSAKATFDLLHKRSSIYSDRPRLAMGGELVGYEHALVVSRYGEQFRQMRRLAHQKLSPRPAQAFWPAEEQATAKFLNCLLQTPEQFVDHIRQVNYFENLSRIHCIGNRERPFGGSREKAVEQFSLSTAPGAFWVDFLPWMKYIPIWFPGAGFQRTAAQWRKDLLHLAKGTAEPSFASGLLEGAYTPETEYLVKWTAFSIYAGGADTTVSAVETFFLAMCMHPRVQAIAQAELDAIVGNERLPNVTDRPSLPYINAILKEVLRWGPVVPGGFPHRVIQDDEYEGYHIPAGSLVIPNIWGMMRNPELFPNPEEFRPERFIGSENIVEEGADPLQLAFGFGRRVCPGQHLAEPSLFLSIAMTLATFTISKARDEKSGEIIEPIADWTSLNISHPVPFRCDIKPRSVSAVELIKQSNTRM